MATKNGKCINIGNCKIADTKQIVEIPDGSEFVCPDCGAELYPVKNDSKGIKIPFLKKILIGIGALIIGGIIYYFFPISPSPFDKLPYIACKDTTFLIGDEKFELHKCDQLVKEGRIVKKIIAKNQDCDNCRDTMKPPPSTPCPNQPGLLHQMRNSEVGIIVAMEEESEPMYFTEKDRKAGFGYEFSKELTKRLGIRNMSTVEGSFETLAGLLGSGRANIVVAGSIKDPSIPNVLWSDSYLENGLCVITKKGSAFSDFHQLAAKKIGIFKGDQPTKDWVTQNISNAQVDDTHDETGWLRHLSDGSWDAVIYDYVYAVKEISKFQNLQIVQFNIKPIEYSILVPCNNEDLLYAINEEIFRMKSSPFYDKLYKKYLSTDKKSIAIPDLSDCDNCYTVRAGETLGEIALNKLGDQKRYTEIFELNKDRLASPHLIYIGTKLKMPVR